MLTTHVKIQRLDRIWMTMTRHDRVIQLTPATNIIQPSRCNQRRQRRNQGNVCRGQINV